MTAASAAETRKAVWQKLLAASAVTNLVSTRIYDHPLQGVSFPYIQIGDQEQSEFDTFSTNGMDSTLTIHCWTRPGGTGGPLGRKQADDIMAAVFDALHRQSLSVTGQNHVFTHREFINVSLDPDGRTYHGISRYRIVTMEA